MAYLIDETDCPEIRALVSPGNLPGITNKELPDPVILMTVYAGLADRSVKMDVPDWASFVPGSDEEWSTRRAVVLRTAARIVTGNYQVTAVTTGDVTTRYSLPDRKARAAELNAEADEQISLVTGESQFGPDFVLAGGVRGR